ncbi:Proprotein convertase subtilisin/kexin type 4 [Stylophora pistillata]|uniref:Proprotein convertase subtilisin/kexin type 4 n=1 Tax=Stylophora pistillata TaxID=50429 RepID=A0A2B4S8L3_STYPI|nr:Proprotein convertase subtilisin/kexin type 4 [Stylophora pistillata]
MVCKRSSLGPITRNLICQDEAASFDFLEGDKDPSSSDDAVSNVKSKKESKKFFVQRIDTIRTQLDTDQQTDSDPEDDISSADKIVPPFFTFTMLSVRDVKQLIQNSTPKSCPLDPMPSTLVSKCEDLFPVLTKIVNNSLQSGCSPEIWKEALVFLFLKKPGLDVIFENFRPVSNLSFVSKLIERAVFNQIHGHLVCNNLYPVAQSASRRNHSTETALLKVMNDILLKMNKQHVTIVVLLDLKAAFDTVDHSILLNRLSSKLGSNGTALAWFRSYCLAVPSECLFGPTAHSGQADAVSSIEHCIQDIGQRMSQDRLLMNDAKTELLLIGTRQQLAKITIDGIIVGHCHYSTISRSESGHGNSCAGIIAAVANNSFCGIGIAYSARIAGIRILGKNALTDNLKAKGISFKPDYVDIYSNSWGPSDSGFEIGEAGVVTEEALKQGAVKGRKGLGSIFVFAAGNGGYNKDNCAFNGLVNSIYTIAIAGVKKDGSLPGYGEKCPGILAVTFSKALFSILDNAKLVQTDELKALYTPIQKNGKAQLLCATMVDNNFEPNSTFEASCTVQKKNQEKSGDSFKRVLLFKSMSQLEVELNISPHTLQRIDNNVVVSKDEAVAMMSPSLKWGIDDEHVAHEMYESKRGEEVADSSNSVGFGLMDAHGLVSLAVNWTTVPPQLNCTVSRISVNRLIPSNGTLKVTASLTDLSHVCRGSQINFLEHVQVRVSLNYTLRGYLEMSLTSPQGSTSLLLQSRTKDNSPYETYLTNWTILTLHHWGENPLGTWELALKNSRPDQESEGSYYKRLHCLDFMTLCHV